VKIFSHPEDAGSRFLRNAGKYNTWSVQKEAEPFVKKTFIDKLTIE
jgi:hypothetical protein